jgi:hypothetical protein
MKKSKDGKTEKKVAPISKRRVSGGFTRDAFAKAFGARYCAQIG